MSGSKLGTNGAKVHFNCNTTRPSGASALATSRDPEGLLLAVATGNRQTRRLAAQNLQKMQRKAATPDRPRPAVDHSKKAPYRL